MKPTQIPDTLQERMTLRRALRDFVQAKSLCPPLSLKQLEMLAAEFVAQQDQADVGNDSCACADGLCSMSNWLMVEINNQLWADIIAAIPHDRRLLMLPKCLSKHGECRGEYDEYGLLCHRCGRCLIPDLQEKAGQLGTLSLVAEGFTQVIELIESHVVDAVIGVSCLDSLEKAFPLLVSHAVPGLAVPLNDNGCINTHVDDSYVAELLSLTCPEQHALLHYEATRQQIDRWFSREELAPALRISDDTPGAKTSQVCLDWMTRGGRRWRPFLLCAVYQSITGEMMLNEDVHRAAVAVECFHKASLIHDDIEDGGMTRYDQPTVNALYGDAYAVNVGDALLGMGYRLLTESNNMELVRLIAEAHTSLCQGQGRELEWTAHPHPAGLDFTLDIIRHKTVPAFEVSLMLGLACTGGQRLRVGDGTSGIQHLRPMLHSYSEALGIAYQLKDDLEDDGEDCSPSAIFALHNEHPDWSDEVVREALSGMIDRYKQQALDALDDLDCLELKRLLYQVTEKILKR
ncbi:MAG: polyprenyl synthetase family protein [Prevotella sp.]|nr:polyprenyl synthetase family protein [Prevotella sp.]